jgi:hypothetical protein
MTSLRTFQNEIDEIHARETAKQRQAVSERHKEKEKESKAPPLPKKEDGDADNPDGVFTPRIEDAVEEIQVSLSLT